jgi:medium-chain acyl-[acyl-carrier-protein] hydrolase
MTPLVSTGTAGGGPASTVTLLCVPHLAGNAAVFSGWGSRPLAGVAVVPAELPGRGRRVREAPLTSIAAIVDDLAARYSDVWTGAFALYGHSMGAIVSYELARLLCELGRPPAALIVGACRSPMVPVDHGSTHARPDVEVLDYLRRQSGTPGAVFDSAELAALVLAVARADLEAWETYVYRAGPALPTPITAVGGTHDPGIDRRDLEGWRACTFGEFRVELLEGDHFFAKTSRAALLQLIGRALSHVGDGRDIPTAVAAAARGSRS